MSYTHVFPGCVSRFVGFVQIPMRVFRRPHDDGEADWRVPSERHFAARENALIHEPKGSKDTIMTIIACYMPITVNPYGHRESYINSQSSQYCSYLPTNQLLPSPSPPILHGLVYRPSA